MSIFDASPLDQLAELQAKRLNEINVNGLTFNLNGSEKSFRGLSDSANTIIFPPATPIHSGCTLDSKTGSYYVASVQGKAGFVQALTLPIVGSIDTMSVKNGSYLRSGSMPILSRSADGVGVPAFGAPATGSTIKHNGQLLTVTSIRRDGPISVLRVQPVQEKSLPAQKYASVFDGRAPVTAPLRGLSAWN